MSNQITGKVLVVSNTRHIPSRNGGEPFLTRELVLDATVFDRMTGQPRPNFPAFEFSGRRCADLDQFRVGDMVTVHFALQGVQYNDRNTNEVKYFTRVQGYKIERVHVGTFPSQPMAYGQQQPQQPPLQPQQYHPQQGMQYQSQQYQQPMQQPMQQPVQPSIPQGPSVFSGANAAGKEDLPF